jgi:hypothetical protein
MNASLPADLNPAPVAPHLDYAKLGPGFANLLAALPSLSDAALDALPHEWVDLPGFIVTLIADEGLSTEMAAHEAGAPVDLVRAYRFLAGI